MMFDDYIVLVDKSRDELDAKIEVHRETLNLMIVQLVGRRQYMKCNLQPNVKTEIMEDHM